MKFTLILNVLALGTLLSGCGRPAGSSPEERTHRQLAPSIQGGSVGNGGDDSPMAGSAWFLGAQSIRACYIAAPDFGADEAVIRRAIEDSFGQWVQYIMGRQLFHPASFPGRDWRVGDPMISTSLELADRCRGGEALTFYLGVRNRRVNGAHSLYQHPLAFAQREFYDARRGRGKGFIWVEKSFGHSEGFPNWSLRHSLRAILLHEWGHVFGCAHVEGTIMDAEIPQLLRGLTVGETSVERRAAFAEIDRVRVLLVPPGALQFHVAENSLGYVVETLNRVGLSMLGPPHLRNGNGTGLFSASDLAGAGGTALVPIGGQRIVIQGLRELGRIWNDAPVFKMSFYRSPGDLSPVTLFSRTASVTFRGFISELDRTTPVIFMFNGGSFRVRVNSLAPEDEFKVLAEF